MKKLNARIARRIAKKISRQIFPTERGEFLLVHSEAVGRIAKIIARKMRIDGQVLEVAGWVHDIGYLEDFDNHSDFTIPLLQEAGYEISPILADCILNHGNGKSPETTEGKIFQLADKLSIFDAQTIRLMLKHGEFPFKQDDIDFLKMMTDKSFELLGKF
jgi:HD superfamily phosphodiesterase